jgi:cytochrome c peroxidase
VAAKRRVRQSDTFKGKKCLARIVVTQFKQQHHTITTRNFNPMMTRNIVLCAMACLLTCSTALYARQLPGALNDTDFYNDGIPDTARVELGRHLFFDKILSGNLNISCATCHHPLADTGDGLSLPVGEGGTGLGISRDTGSGYNRITDRVPRNAPPVFNLGAREFTLMFHDGRIMQDDSRPSGFQSPAGDDLPAGLDNALAVQAMFPVTSSAEMAGQAGENAQADAAAAGNLAGPGGVWEQLADKLRAIPDYVDRFMSARISVMSMRPMRLQPSRPLPGVLITVPLTSICVATSMP